MSAVESLRATAATLADAEVGGTLWRHDIYASGGGTWDLVTVRKVTRQTIYIGGPDEWTWRAFDRSDGRGKTRMDYSIAYGQEEAENECWRGAHQTALTKAVASCLDVATLRKIAALLGEHDRDVPGVITNTADHRTH